MIDVTFEYEFPIANWEGDESRIIQPSPDCDVYYSHDLVDTTTQNLLQWSLDKMCKDTQDYFVPKYQNIIDPNMFADPELL